MGEEVDIKLQEAEEVMEMEMVPADDMDYIMGAYYALSAVDGMDAMTEIDKKRIDRIKRKSIKIIDYMICQFYDELFDEPKTE